MFDRKIKSHWSIALPLIQRLLNTSTRITTGCAPATIMFGTSISKLEQKLLYPTLTEEGEEIIEYPEYIRELLKIQAEIVARAPTILTGLCQENILNER